MIASIRCLAASLLAATLISVPVSGNAQVAGAAEHAQVIVVGAGMAGMTASLSLARKGIDVILLEKEDAVGGKVYSPVLGGVAANLGAQFYFPGINPMVDEYFKSLPVEEIRADGFFGTAYSSRGRATIPHQEQ